MTACLIALLALFSPGFDSIPDQVIVDSLGDDPLVCDESTPAQHPDPTDEPWPEENASDPNSVVTPTVTPDQGTPARQLFVPRTGSSLPPWQRHTEFIGAVSHALIYVLLNLRN